MKPFMDFEVFKQIKNIEKFNSVHVAFDMIEWDCRIDLDSEFIIEKSVPLQKESSTAIPKDIPMRHDITT